MKINLAHIREHSTSGGWIDFAVFDAKPQVEILAMPRYFLISPLKLEPQG